MNNIFCRSVSIVLLFWLAIAPLRAANDYAGQYVLKLGTRNFLVLNLTDTNGKLTGKYFAAKPHGFRIRRCRFLEHQRGG